MPIRRGVRPAPARGEPPLISCFACKRQRGSVRRLHSTTPGEEAFQRRRPPVKQPIREFQKQPRFHYCSTVAALGISSGIGSWLLYYGSTLTAQDADISSGEIVSLINFHQKGKGKLPLLSWYGWRATNHRGAGQGLHCTAPRLLVTGQHQSSPENRITAAAERWTVATTDSCDPAQRNPTTDDNRPGLIGPPTLQRSITTSLLYDDGRTRLILAAELDFSLRGS